MKITDGGAGQITRLQTLDQARARYAYERSIAARDELDTSRGEAERYCRLAEMLPSLIQANGLGATLAFLASKSAKEKDSGGEARGEKAPVRNLEKAEGRLFEDLAAWLTRAEWPSGPYCRKLQEEESSGRLVLLRRLTTNDAQTYRRATVETLALASWLKRLSAALIEKKGKD